MQQNDSLVNPTARPGGYFLNFTEFGPELLNRPTALRAPLSPAHDLEVVPCRLTRRMCGCRCAGLQINAGHEVMMDRCWLGEHGELVCRMTVILLTSPLHSY